MERKNWTLLAISAAGDRGLSPVQLQKVLFVLGQEMADAVGKHFYKFKPYHYGPFDADIYTDAETLEDEGLISIARVGERNLRHYTATRSGADEAGRIATQIDGKAVDFLNKLVAWTLRQSFSQLVSAIYTRWPAMKANSVFQE